MDNVLLKVNSIHYIKPILSLTNIPSDTPMKILKMEKKNTKYGRKICTELEEHVVFLPEKYNELDEEDLSVLSTGAYTITKTVNSKFIFNKIV